MPYAADSDGASLVPDGQGYKLVPYGEYADDEDGQGT